MAQAGRGRGALGVCRAGLALTLTGGLAAAGGAPFAGWLALAGVVVLAGGGWLTQKTSRGRRSHRWTTRSPRSSTATG